MHLLTEQRTTIRRPVHEVFAYLADMENFAAWFPGVTAISEADDLPLHTVGKEYLETVRIPLRGKRRIRLKVKELSEDHRFVTEGKLPPIMPRMEIDFCKESAGATTILWRMYSRNNSLLFRVIFLPLVRKVMQPRAVLGMQRLKKILEAG